MPLANNWSIITSLFQVFRQCWLASVRTSSSLDLKPLIWLNFPVKNSSWWSAYRIGYKCIVKFDSLLCYFIQMRCFYKIMWISTHSSFRMIIRHYKNNVWLLFLTAYIILSCPCRLVVKSTNPRIIRLTFIFMVIIFNKISKSKAIKKPSGWKVLFYKNSNYDYTFIISASFTFNSSSAF